MERPVIKDSLQRRSKQLSLMAPPGRAFHRVPAPCAHCTLKQRTNARLTRSACVLTTGHVRSRSTHFDDQYLTPGDSVFIDYSAAMAPEAI